MQYARDKGLPAVALCISTTYGPARLGADPARLGHRPRRRRTIPVLHGLLLGGASGSKMPLGQCFSPPTTAATAHRYIISDRYMSTREVHDIAARAVGRRPPRIPVPMAVMRGGARVNDLAARLLGRDLPFAYVGARMAELMSPLDHSKAERELGWKPEPVEESIRKAARFFAAHSAD